MISAPPGYQWAELHPLARLYLDVFQLDLQVPLVVHVLLCQEHSVAVVSSLAKNLDGDLDIKVDLTFTGLLKYRGILLISKLGFRF